MSQRCTQPKRAQPQEQDDDLRYAEIVACTIKCDVNVSVWQICEEEPSNYERTAVYAREGATATICLHYVGGRHYELLVPQERRTRSGAEVHYRA